MPSSLYANYVQKYFPKVVLKVVEKLNGKNQGTLTYLFKDLLDKQFSVDGRWATITGSYTRVAADVVAMDSELPLKVRDALEKATGDIAKIGMEMRLNERQMSDIDAMISQGLPEGEIVRKILDDTARVIEGIFERLELMFLQGLSTGIALADSDNVGTGIRINYGFLSENKFGVNTLWSTPASSKVIDDINRVITKATNDGNRIVHAYGNTATFNALISSTQFKEQFAFSLNYVGGNVPVPTKPQAIQLFKDIWGFDYTFVDRVVKTEKDGVRTDQTPWKDGIITFTCDKIVGSLVYARLAEESHPVAGVSYQKADSYLLVSKFRRTDPTLAEITRSQARVVPIVSDVDRIYQLDSKTVQG